MNVLVRGGLRIHTVPKNASRSMRRSIKDEMYGSAAPEVPGPEVRFMVVRHPGQRLVSAYAYMMQQLLMAGHKSRVMPEQYVRWQDLGYRDAMTFREFLAVAVDIHDEDAHTRAQVHYAGPHKINILCPYENIQEGWERLRLQFDFLKPLECLNASRHGVWESYFSTGRTKLVARIFSEDLALYERAVTEYENGRQHNHDPGSERIAAEPGVRTGH